MVYIKNARFVLSTKLLEQLWTNMGSFLHVLTLFLAISAAGFKVADGAASGQLPGLGAAKAGRGAYSSDSSSSGNVEYSKESYEYSIRNSEYVSYEDRSEQPYYFKTVEYKSGIREYYSDSDNQLAYAYSYSGYDGGSSTSIEEGSSYTVEYGSSSSVEYGSSSSSESGSSGSSGSGSSGSGSSGSGSAGSGSGPSAPTEDVDPLNFNGKSPISYVGGNKPNPDKIDPDTGKLSQDKFPGASLQLPGKPFAPGDDGPVGVIDPSGLNPSDILERDGNIIYLKPSSFPERGIRYPGFAGTPGSRGPKGFLDINAIPGLSDQLPEPFPGSTLAPIGFLNSSLLPSGQEPPVKGPLIFPGDKDSVGAEVSLTGGFISTDTYHAKFESQIKGSISYDDLINLIKPLFPGGKLNKGDIPREKLFPKDSKDGYIILPGIKGTPKDLKFQDIGSRVNKNGARGGAFYLPGLVRLIAYLPPNNLNPDTIKSSGGYGDPWPFKISGTPGYVCALPKGKSIVDQKGVLES